MNRFATLLALALIIPAVPAWTQTTISTSQSLSQMAGQVEAFEKRAKASAGVYAVDIASGRELLSHRSGELFMPASNMKILTSAFALARLGGGFQFATTLYQLGQDLVIVGNFDPAFGDPVLAKEQNKSIYAELDLWAAAVRRRVGATLAGDIIVVSRGAAKSYRHPDWPVNQHERWYGAPISELNINNNCLDVVFRLKDKQLTPELSPQSRFFKVSNDVRPGAKHLWSLRTSADDSTVSLFGTAASAGGEPFSVAINDPPLLLGRVLAERLEQAGVKVQGSVRKCRPDQVAIDRATAIAQTTTPMNLVMGRANKRSLNMAAEGMFLRAGDGTFAGSAKLCSQTLEQSYGLKAASYEISDGSGFSRKNSIAPESMVKLLRGILRRGDADVFVKSLPVGGADGTLSNRFDDAACRGRVLGKTGYIAGVSCLSGYILDRSGKPAIAYSILVNKCADISQARALQENICRALVNQLDAR